MMQVNWFGGEVTGWMAWLSSRLILLKELNNRLEGVRRRLGIAQGEESKKLMNV